MSIKPHIRSKSIAVRNAQARHEIYGTKLIEVYTEQRIRTMDETEIVYVFEVDYSDCVPYPVIFVEYEGVWG